LRVVADAPDRYLRLYSPAQAEAELVRAKALGARLVAIGDPVYPRLLAAVDDAPPLILIMGNAYLGNRESFAIAGARNASAAGVRLTRMLAVELGRADLVIVSRHARGIDGAAHGDSLASGVVAVLAGGIDLVHPPKHQGLHEQIADGGFLSPKCRPAPDPRRATSCVATDSFPESRLAF
jgi:DNA processing protein